jgi:hypothetical protein
VFKQNYAIYIDIWRNGGKAPLILARALRKQRDVHYLTGKDGPRAVHDIIEKKIFYPFREMNSDLSFIQYIAQSLYRPS